MQIGDRCWFIGWRDDGKNVAYMNQGMITNIDMMDITVRSVDGEEFSTIQENIFATNGDALAAIMSGAI